MGEQLVDAESTATTPGQIELTVNDDKTVSRDPNDPTKPGGIVDNGGMNTSNQGPLSLDVAPAEFDFGSQKMYISAHTYLAVNEDASTVTGEPIENQYLQITDNRDAGIYGWVVKVKQDTYLTDGEKVLKGTTINIPEGIPRNELNIPATDPDLKLTTQAVKIDTTEQTIFSAKETNKGGKATSTSVWKAADVSLTIPANTAQAGNYTNTITWTLTAETIQ